MMTGDERRGETLAPGAPERVTHFFGWLCVTLIFVRLKCWVARAIRNSDRATGIHLAACGLFSHALA
jgi:hypothetical protein